jgi:aspartyl-tRNA(Asn)/glutamyl-tRNA(Gln) amidotransferase subunit A
VKNYATFRDIQHDLQQGNVTCQDLVRHHLSRIQEKSHLNVFLSVYAEEALIRATQIDSKLKERKAGKLAGLIVGIKDVFAYQDHPLQAAKF